MKSLWKRVLVSLMTDSRKVEIRSCNCGGAAGLLMLQLLLLGFHRGLGGSCFVGGSCFLWGL